MWRKCIGGGGFVVNPQRTIKTLLILIALLGVVVSVFVCSDSGQEVNVDAATVEATPEGGYSIDTSALEQESVKLFTSTGVDKLYDYLVITDLTGQLPGNLDSTEYRFGVTSFHEGSNSITILLNDGTQIGTIIVEVESVEPVSIVVGLREGMSIYSSYNVYQELARDAVLVTVHYNDGTSDFLDSDDFTINGDWVFHEDEDQMNLFTVTCVVDGVTLSDTFETKVLEQLYQRIEVSFSQTINIPSSESSGAILKTNDDYGTLVVTGYFSVADQTGRVLDVDEYDIIGNFWTGTEKYEGGVKEVTLIVQDETGTLKEELKVDVQYVPPDQFTYDYVSKIYYPGDTFIKDSTLATLVYMDPFDMRDVTDKEYTVEYQNGGDSIQYGDSYVTLIYTENGKELECRVDITVREATAIEPSFSNSSPTYNGELQTTQMSGFVDEYMNIAVTRDNQDVDFNFTDSNGDGIYDLSITNAGTYRIEIILDEGYKWRFSDEVVFEWTIEKADIEVSLVLDDYEWYFGESGPTLNDADIIGNAGNADPSFVYYGTANDGTNSRPSTNPYMTMPIWAGTWYVVAIIPATDNYNGDNTAPVGFTIMRAPVDAPVADDKTYDGTLQYASFDGTTGLEVDFTHTSVGQMYANTGYTATVTMNDNDAYNHEWRGGTWTDGKNTITVYWSISPAKVSLPFVNETGPWMYAENPKDTAVEHTVTFGDSGNALYHITGLSDGGSYDDLSITRSQVGTYIVTFALNDTNNYVWDDATGTGTRTCSWSISMATNTVDSPTIDSEIVFGQTFSPVATSIFGTPYFLYSDSQTGTFTDTVPTNVGTYWVKAVVNATVNWGYAESATVSFQITKAQNSIAIELGGQDNPFDKTYDGSMISTPEVTVTDGEVDFEYSDSIDGTYQTGLPSDAGTWYVRAVVTGSQNYADATSEPVTVFIDWIAIPFPTVTGELRFNGTEATPNGTAQTPTVSLAFMGYPSGQGQSDAITISVTGKVNANTDANPNYVLTVTPGTNYRWETLEGDSYRYEYELEWVILPQQVSIDINQRAAERTGSQWNPTITSDYRFSVSFPNSVEISLYHATATLVSTNYEWVVSTDADTNGTLYDYLDESNQLVMYIGYSITETRYNIFFEQNDWNYGGTPGSFTATPDNDDERISLMLESSDGHWIIYRPVLGNDQYGEQTTMVPTEAGMYQAAIVVAAIPGYYASIQSDWDEFEIVAATIAEINPNPSTDTVYSGDAYEIIEIIDESAVTFNGQETTWWFSLQESNSKEDFSQNVELTDAGIYKVWYYVSAPNHMDSGISLFEITIIPKPVTVVIGQAQVDEEGNILQNAMNYNGQVPSISSLDIEYSLAEGSSLGTGDTLDDLGFVMTLVDITKNADTYTVTGSDNDDYDNYAVTCTPGTFQILKIDLEVNATGFTNTYDNKEYGFASNIGGLVTTTEYDDTVDWSFRIGETGEYVDTGVTDADTYTVYLRGESHNYNIIATEFVTVVIEKRTITATVQDVDVEYGREVSGFAVEYSGYATGHAEEDLGLSPSFNHAYEPGHNAYDQNLPIGVTVSGNETFTKNYTVYVVEGGLDVIPRKVTAIISNETITYGDEPAALESTCEDMYGEDSIMDFVTLSIDGYGDSMPVDVATYHIIGQDKDVSDNYEVSFVGEGTQNTFGTYTIVAITVTIVFDGDSSYTYDGEEVEIGHHFEHNGTAYTIPDNLVNVTFYKIDGDVTTDIGSTAPTNVGSYRYQVTVDSDNYSASASSSMPFSITPALYNEFYGQTITAVDPEVEYDGQPHHPTMTVTGGDGVIHDLEFGYSAYATNVTKGAMEVTVTITSTDPNIYAPGVNDYETTITGYVTVLPREVAVEWPDKEYIYNGMVQYVYPTCVIDGETVELTATLSSGLEFKNYRDSAYWFTATFKEDFAGAGNYELTGDVKDYEMNKRPVSITLHGYDKVYGDDVDFSRFSWTYDEGSLNLVDAYGVEIAGGSADAGFRYRTDADANSPVSTGTNTYYVAISNPSDYSLNYDLDVTEGTLTIVHRVIEITVEEQYATYTGNEPPVSSEVGVDYTITEGEILEGNLSTAITLNKDQGVDVGSYDITAIPGNLNYTITVTNGADKFEITGAPINANVVYNDFDFDNTYHSTSDENFYRYASSAISGAQFEWTFSFEENGTYSDELTFKDAGIYTVHYKVSAENHETFSSEVKFEVTEGTNEFGAINELDDWTFDDGSQSEITVPEPTTIFGSEVFTTIYKAVIGSDGAVDVEATISNNSTIPAFYSDTDAGTYLVVFDSEGQASDHDSNRYNYRDIQTNYTVTIGQKAVNSVTWGHTQHEFTDNPIANTIKIVTDYMAFGTTTSGVETTLSDDGTTMTMYASAVGDYSVVVRLTDDNYRWMDPDDDDSRCYTAVWKIYYAEDENKWTSDLVLEDWPYDGTAHQPSITSEHGTPYFLYSVNKDDLDSFSRKPFTDAGTYWVIAVVDAGINYPSISTEPEEYTISPAKVPEPNVDTSGIVPYNGETQTVTVSGYDEDKVYVTGISGQDAGEYKVIIGLFNTNNYVWESDDGSEPDSEPIEIPWSIERAVVKTPQYGEDGGHIPYVRDTEQTYTFVMDDNVSVYGNQGSVADEYIATFSLVDADNYKWDDSIVNKTENNRYSLVWYIDPIVVDAPEIKSESPWVPGGVSNPVVGMNPLYMGVDLGDYNGMILAHVDGSKVSLVTYTSDDYNVKFYLKNKNYTWSESADAVNGIVTLPWSVTPITLGLDLGDTSINYTGSEITYTPVDFNSNTMSITDNRKTGVGNYTAVITLHDSTNYRWDDSLSEYRDGYTLRIPWSIEQVTFDIDDLEVDLQFEYDGTSHVPVFVDKPDWLITTVSEGDGVKDVGTGWVTVHFSVRQGSNYTISETEKPYEVTVTARHVTIVVDSAEMTYGQKVPAIGWDYQDGSLGFVADDNVTVTTGTDYPENGGCGGYVTTATHDANGNYSVTVVLGKLTVNPIVVEEPSGTDVRYTGEEVSHPFDEIGYTVVGGDNVGTLPGNYTAVLRLEANHVWWDGTYGDKTVLWRIVGEGTLVKQYFVVDESPETYTGKEIFKSVTCVNEDLKLGTHYEVDYTDNVNAGQATITISGLREYADSDPLVYHFTIEKADTVVDFVNDGFERSEDSDSFRFLPYVSGLVHDELRWTSSDESIATVDPITGEITVLSVGEVTITATFPGDDNRNGFEDSIVLNVGKGETTVYVDRVVYVKVPVEVPGGDDDDDQTDDKPETVYIEKDNDLYIWLLIVMAVICVCFAAYILYSHRDQEGGA